MEGDQYTRATVNGNMNFNPLPPHGGRPISFATGSEMQSFQSTPSAWRETICHVTVACTRRISIHSLRMEGDQYQIMFRYRQLLFQSTPSAWRETILPGLVRRPLPYFNPLPPHGGRQLLRPSPLADGAFQSTPSAWRETLTRFSLPSHLSISIHSLRMEGDVQIWDNIFRSYHFNPLPPHGGRQGNLSKSQQLQIFQSTPSAWRETDGLIREIAAERFQSTPSAWRETCQLQIFRFGIPISIHSLRMEGDCRRFNQKSGL